MFKIYYSIFVSVPLGTGDCTDRSHGLYRSLPSSGAVGTMSTYPDINNCTAGLE